MIDNETNSQWSHLLGKAMKGPLAGEELTTIESVMVDWQTWKKSHPDSTAVVMSRTAEEYKNKIHQSTHFLVFGIAQDGDSRAWRIDVLLSFPVVNDEFAGRKVVVVYDHDSGLAALFDRTVGDTVYSFEKKEGKLVDQQTGSHWDGVTGKAIDGPLKGRELQLLPAMFSRDFAWMLYHPESSYGEGSGASSSLDSVSSPATIETN